MATPFKAPQLPGSIPFAKLADVCRILGIPAKEVRVLTSDAHEGHIAATLYVVDAEGNKLLNPAGDAALTYDVRIPLTSE